MLSKAGFEDFQHQEEVVIAMGVICNAPTELEFLATYRGVRYPSRKEE